MGAKAIKLGSFDKHPVYCFDLNVVWNMCNGINLVVYTLYSRLTTFDDFNDKKIQAIYHANFPSYCLSIFSKN